MSVSWRGSEGEATMKSGSIYGTAIFQTRQAIYPHGNRTTMTPGGIRHQQVVRRVWTKSANEAVPTRAFEVAALEQRLERLELKDDPEK